MPDINLTQDEADGLIAMQKYRADDEIFYFPGRGHSICIPLISDDPKETFLLDIERGRINLSKVKYQNRCRDVIVLLRLDINGPPHRNPDDAEMGCPHLHIYREGYGTKWAFPAPTSTFINLADISQTVRDFMRYCNIIKPPNIQRGWE